MPSVSELVWKLRTDPFYPTVDEAGTPIPVNALETSLDPLADARVLPYYFDVYDWSNSDLVGGLSKHTALIRFPTSRTLPGTGLMVLMSGAGETGLDSLANLILHKINLVAHGRTLRVVDVELPGRDRSRNAAIVARRIINNVAYGQPKLQGCEDIVAEMRREYERVNNEQVGRKDATYSELFQTFRDLLAPLSLALVIKIFKGGDNDSWVHIHESASSCCSYSVVMTPDFAYAKTCYDVMIGKRLNVAWIKARLLDREKAQRYLEHRLATARFANAGLGELLIPFTPDALSALYEPGSTAARGKSPQYPVGWLHRTLYRAFNDHLEATNARFSCVPIEALSAIDPATTFLGRPEMIAARDVLNRGSLR